MSDSIFEPMPAGIAEPPARRRQLIASKPGGATALKVRDSLMARRSRAQIARFARSEIGIYSQELLADLNDSQSGETGFIVCNGPSLNKTNLDLVQGHPYLLMNRGYLLAERLPGSPSALCVGADLVLDQYGTEVAAIDAPLLLPAHHQNSVARRDRVAFVEKQRDWLFASDIGTSMHMGYTVTFWALQLAFHLGWEKCIIIGMDHRYDQTGDPTVAVRTEGSDKNHFDPNYFQHGAAWLLPALEMNEYSYRLARAAYEAHGREVVDCSVDGACRIFRRSTVEVELNG